MAVSAVIQSAARLERGRTLNNVRGREGGREGREGRGGRGGEGGEGRGGEGRGGEGRGGEGRGGGRAGQGRAGEGRGGGGQGRAGQGRGGEGRGGRGGEGRGGEGRGETLLTIIFEPKTARFMSSRHVLNYVIITTRAQTKLNVVFFFLILWLFDFSAILLLLAFASSSCLIYKFILKHMRNYARCYELMC